MHGIMSTGLLAHVEGGGGCTVQLLSIPVVYVHGKVQHLAPFVGEGSPYDYGVMGGYGLDIAEAQVGGDAGGDIHV